MQRIGIVLGALSILLFSAATTASTAYGQDALGWMNTPGVSPDEVNEVAKEIWCPLCSGVRLDGCELKACEQMKDVIALKLAEGEGSPEIKEYFLAQYGPQILGEPPREGFNWLAWILPIAVFMGGGVFLFRQARRMVHTSTAGETADAAPGAGPESPAATSQAEAWSAEDSQSGNENPSDAERRLDEELAKYD